jgi:hypothetical protein
MSEIEQENKPPLNINAPVDWHIPENLGSQYISSVFTQAGEVIEEVNDDEVMALFDEIEPYYSRTNQMLANL